MKIAYCLHGCIGGLSGKSGEKLDGSEKVHSIVSENNKKFFVDHEFDFFIHSWDTHLKDKYINTYNPKKYKIENQIEFSHKSLPKTKRSSDHLSRWYSAKEVLNLKSIYEEKNKIKYDLVILTRLDIFWLKKINFNEIDTSVYNFDQSKVGYSFCSKTSVELADRMIMSNSENMDLFKTMYDELPNIVKNNPKQYGGISSHFSIPILLKNNKKRENVSFPYNFWVENQYCNIKDCHFSLLRYITSKTEYHKQDLIKIEL